MRAGEVLIVGLSTIVVVVAFVIGRKRVGDWNHGRDLPVAIGIITLGVGLLIALVFGPDMVVFVGLPATLALGGAFLARQAAAPGVDQRHMRPLGMLAVVAGVLGMVVGIARVSLEW